MRGRDGGEGGGDSTHTLPCQTNKPLHLFCTFFYRPPSPAILFSSTTTWGPRPGPAMGDPICTFQISEKDEIAMLNFVKATLR